MAQAATIRKAVWFYNLELALLADGSYHVSLSATTVDEEEPQLVCQTIFDKHVASIDEALLAIKDGVTGVV